MGRRSDYLTFKVSTRVRMQYGAGAKEGFVLAGTMKIPLMESFNQFLSRYILRSSFCLLF